MRKTAANILQVSHLYKSPAIGEAGDFLCENLSLLLILHTGFFVRCGYRFAAVAAHVPHDRVCRSTCRRR